LGDRRLADGDGILAGIEAASLSIAAGAASAADAGAAAEGKEAAARTATSPLGLVAGQRIILEGQNAVGMVEAAPLGTPTGASRPAVDIAAKIAAAADGTSAADSLIVRERVADERY
jgi:hypothetical protein